MSNLVPLRSMLGSFNRWPSIWDEDEDLQLFSPSYKSSIDLYETENDVVIKANVAGVSSDDINVTFEKGVLWIQANATKEEKEDEFKYYNKSTWNYSYKVAVPGLIDHNQEPDVTLDNGVLKVVFPKSKAAKPKKLQIKSTAK